MGNHVSEINQNKGRDTWFKDAFSVAKRSQSCFMQARIAPCRLRSRQSTGKL